MKERIVLSLAHFLSCGIALTSAFSAESAPRVTSAGTYYGHIVDIEPDGVSITVKPIDPKLPRQRFYLDKQTKFRVDGKVSKFQNIFRNDKVAVRFFAEEKVALADEVFVVFGEFKPEDYKPKRRVMKRPAGQPKAPATTKGKESGSHH